MEPTKQIIGTLLVALSLIAVIGYVSWQNDRQFVADKTAEFQRNQLHFAQQVADKVLATFMKLHDALYALSQLPDVQFLNPNECLLNMIRTYKMNAHLVSGIFRVDATENVYYAYPPTVPLVAPEVLHPVFEQARLTGHTLFRALPARGDQPAALLVVRPVYTVQGQVHLNPSNKFSGLLIFTLPLGQLRHETLALSTFGDHGDLWIIDETGRFVIWGDEAQLGKRVDDFDADALTPSQRARLQTLLNAIQRQGEGTVTTPAPKPFTPGPAASSERDEEHEGGYLYRVAPDDAPDTVHLVAYTPLRLPYQRWEIAVVNPRSDATRTLDKAISERWFHSLALLGTTLSMTLLLIWIIRRNHEQQINVVQEGEKALREAEAKYRTLVEDADDSILILQDGRTVYRNPACLRLVGAESDPGDDPFLDRVAPEDRDRARALYQRPPQTQGPPKQFEVLLQTPYGRRTMEVKPRQIEYQGRPATMVLMRDITERRQLENQLRQAHKMEAIGRLAGGIAHDFNNILLAILGYSEMVRDDLPEGSLSRDNVEQVLKAGHRAKDLVQQILAFSRQHEQEPQRIELGPIVKETVKLLRALLPTTIEIAHELDPACGQVFADPTQIHQVLMNLCTNAGHAMRDTGGTLEVRLDTFQIDTTPSPYKGIPPGTYVRLTVRDTGCGMTPAVMERIFDPFFTTKPIGEGTGMGLAVVHGIVDSYGGTVHVTSVPGQGTTFEVLLPQQEPVAEIQEPDTDGLPEGTERILLVDDEADLVHLGKQMLERLGYTVVACTQSVEALELFRRQPDAFDLVITDQTMPQMTGEELTRHLLWLRPELPVILITGYSQTLSPEQAKALGIRAYVMKPMVTQEFARVIRQVLAVNPAGAEAG